MAPTKRQSTIAQGLLDIGITDSSVFAGCGGERESEFKILKKLFHKQCLTHHPDKGGDPDEFRRIRAAFELLRDLHTGKQPCRGQWLFSECVGLESEPTEVETFDMSGYDFDFSNMETPSWEYYAQAEQVDVPPYRVELAKSGRSKCKAMGLSKKCDQVSATAPSIESTHIVQFSADHVSELIPKGDLRAGSIDKESGTYTKWKHLRCWRVPMLIWLGLPDPNETQDYDAFVAALASMSDCALSGFSDLPEDAQKELVDHCRDRQNWARTTKKMPPPAHRHHAVMDDIDVNLSPDPSGESNGFDDTSAMVVVREKFAFPRPGVDGASDHTVFQGKRFCLTGIFPEVGGGIGLSMGKDRVKEMIQSFGGRVTCAVSGKTNVLVAGKEPGFSKVSKARASSKCKIASIKELKAGLEAGLDALESFEFYNRDGPIKIQSFSAGYRGNGLALIASAEAKAEASYGTKTPAAKGDSSSSKHMALEARPGSKSGQSDSGPTKKPPTMKRKKSSGNKMPRKKKVFVLDE